MSLKSDQLEILLSVFVPFWNNEVLLVHLYAQPNLETNIWKVFHARLNWDGILTAHQIKMLKKKLF